MTIMPASTKKKTAKKTTTKAVKKAPVKKVVKKTAAKKAPAKKATTKAAKPAVKAATSAQIKTITDKLTKTQIITMIAENTGLPKKEVVAVFDTLANITEASLKKRGIGEVTIPSLGVKITRKRKPATKKRKGVNPFTGEEITIQAKPARNVVKLTALKALKEVVNQ
jgi:nucleoid DNA-binding protein